MQNLTRSKTMAKEKHEPGIIRPASEYLTDLIADTVQHREHLLDSCDGSGVYIKPALQAIQHCNEIILCASMELRESHESTGKRKNIENLELELILRKKRITALEEELAKQGSPISKPDLQKLRDDLHHYRGKFEESCERIESLEASEAELEKTNKELLLQLEAAKDLNDALGEHPDTLIAAQQKRIRTLRMHIKSLAHRLEDILEQHADWAFHDQVAKDAPCIVDAEALLKILESDPDALTGDPDVTHQRRIAKLREEVKALVVEVDAIIQAHADWVYHDLASPDEECIMSAKDVVDALKHESEAFNTPPTTDGKEGLRKAEADLQRQLSEAEDTMVARGEVLRDKEQTIKDLQGIADQHASDAKTKADQLEEAERKIAELEKERAAWLADDHPTDSAYVRDLKVEMRDIGMKLEQEQQWKQEQLDKNSKLKLDVEMHKKRHRKDFKRIAHLEQHNSEYERLLAQSYAANKTLKSQLQERDSEITRLRKLEVKHAELNSNYETLQRNLALASEKVKTLEADAENPDTATTLSDLTTARDLAERELAELRKQYDNLQEKWGTLNAENTELQQKWESAEGSRLNLERLREKQDKEIEALHAQVSSAGVALGTLKEQQGDDSPDTSTAQSERITDLETQVASLEASLQDRDETIKQREEQIQNVKALLPEDPGTGLPHNWLQDDISNEERYQRKVKRILQLETELEKEKQLNTELIEAIDGSAHQVLTTHLQQKADAATAEADKWRRIAQGDEDASETLTTAPSEPVLKAQFLLGKLAKELAEPGINRDWLYSQVMQVSETLKTIDILLDTPIAKAPYESIIKLLGSIDALLHVPESGAYSVASILNHLEEIQEILESMPVADIQKLVASEEALTKQVRILEYHNKQLAGTKDANKAFIAEQSAEIVALRNQRDEARNDAAAQLMKYGDIKEKLHACQAMLTAKNDDPNTEQLPDTGDDD